MPRDAVALAAARAAHRDRCERLRSAFGAAAGRVGLAKDTSNLFRDRAPLAEGRLDVRDFDHVLQVDAAGGWVDAEGMVPYDALADACLGAGTMPAVVPQLKSITLGGAVAGVGVEATSFRHGLVHDTVLELDVLTGDGRIVTARPDNEHAALYFGFPNSYGTLGYALRVRAKLAPVQPFVRVEHRRYLRADEFFAALQAACAGPADFVEGVVFGRDDLVLSVARFVEAAPRLSHYTYEQIYWKSLRRRDEDWLSVRDWLWRWDTDWFWCSKNVGAQNPLLRRLYGPDRLNSRTYQKIMRWNARVGLMRRLERLSGWHRESIIQDVDLPIERAAEYLDFHLREIGILPVWICPIGATPLAPRYTLFPRPAALLVNFGFWDVKRTREAHPPGHFNRLIERTVVALGGIKSLYSDSFFERAEFEHLYGGAAYAQLKQTYDPQRRFGELYDKCVLRH
jgi:FAD/FMN-containing dehydrogenase